MTQKKILTDSTVFGDMSLTLYLATAIAEGFCEGEGASNDDQLKAWAYLIRTGQCWSLQGWFGRTATAIIQEGVISTDGTINWDLYNDLKTT
ncbi:MAG: hypothetical protein ABIH82_00700 [Candidatus Woesearchaeota archaeon]